MGPGPIGVCNLVLDMFNPTSIVYNIKTCRQKPKCLNLIISNNLSSLVINSLRLAYIDTMYIYTLILKNEFEIGS